MVEARIPFPKHSTVESALHKLLLIALEVAFSARDITGSDMADGKTMPEQGGTTVSKSPRFHANRPIIDDEDVSL